MVITHVEAVREPPLQFGILLVWRQLGVTGPWAPERGTRFDPGKVLLDPYGRAAAVPPGYRRDLANYWGYSPVSFFAPHQGYGSRKDPLAVLDEFRW